MEIAAMTPKEIRRRISGLISATPGLPPLDQPTINAFYYDGALKAAELADIEELKAQDIVSVVASQVDYLMPADVMEFVDVRFLNQNSGFYERLHNVELSALSEYRGDVLVYARAGVYRTAGADRGKKILRLSLTPSAAITNGLVVTYQCKPQRLEDVGDDNEIIDLPERIQSLIPYYAAFQWFSNQGAKPIKDIGAQYYQYFKDECAEFHRKRGDQHQRDVRREISTDWGGLTL